MIDHTERPPGWSQIELARLYGCLRVRRCNLQWKKRKYQIVTAEEQTELAQIEDALSRLGGKDA